MKYSLYEIKDITEHITTQLADEGNYAYYQSRGDHNIKHTL